MTGHAIVRCAEHDTEQCRPADHCTTHQLAGKARLKCGSPGDLWSHPLAGDVRWPLTQSKLVGQSSDRAWRPAAVLTLAAPPIIPISCQHLLQQALPARGRCWRCCQRRGGWSCQRLCSSCLTCIADRVLPGCPTSDASKNAPPLVQWQPAAWQQLLDLHRRRSLSWSAQFTARLLPAQEHGERESSRVAAAHHRHSSWWAVLGPEAVLSA